MTIIMIINNKNNNDDDNNNNNNNNNDNKSALLFGPKIYSQLFSPSLNRNVSFLMFKVKLLSHILFKVFTLKN